LAGLWARFAEIERRARARTGQTEPYRFIVIHEAGLDGFWLHRALEAHGCESYVVDAASIAAARRAKRKKTDRLDGEALLRALLAFKRGEPRVCSMVRAPTPEAEDERRACRERKEMVCERVRSVNRIKGLLYSQGVVGFAPLRSDRRRRLEELRTGDGRDLGANLKAQLARELDRLELLLEQIAEVERARDERLGATRKARAGAKPTRPGAPAREGLGETMEEPAAASPSWARTAAMLFKLRGIGCEFASSLASEGLSRDFDNRRQVGAYSGLAATPWRSGSIDHEQGVSKAGNPRLRTTMIQVAWLWLQHQPKSALTRWYLEKLAGARGKHAKKRLIVALARKLVIALWKYVAFGEAIEGAVTKA
jgi:transposase